MKWIVSVKIKTFDDGVVLVFDVVKFISCMHIDLISLSKMDSKSNKIYVESRAFYVIHDGFLIMKGEQYNGLYHLMECYDL